MTAPNHIVGGVVVTGICGGFMGVNILENPYYLVLIVFAAQLPDIDHTKSIIGLTFYPIAKWISQRWPHRTITHSLAALCLLSGIVSTISFYFTETKIYGTIFFLAYLSHLILDMVTAMGVPLFYPFARNPCVIPGDKNLRFESGNLRTETGAFFFFIAMGIFMQPLMENGFWTQYNRAFGTMKHLYSEFTKSEDLLEVDYKYRIASDDYEGKGVLIESSPTGCTLWKEGARKFIHLNKEDMVVQSVIPEHTGRRWEIEQLSFINIETDSLTQLLDNRTVIETEIHGTNEFAFVANGLAQQGKVVKANYVHDAIVKDLIQEIEKEQITFQSSPRIRTLQFQISRIKTQHQAAVTKHQHHQAEKRKLESDISQEQDLFKRETAVKKLSSMKEPAHPQLDTEKIAMLETQIKEIKLSDSQKYETKKLAAANKYKEKLQGESNFTGYIKYILISSPKLSQK